MEKVKNIYFGKRKGDYGTGLFLEIESGKILEQQSTDSIVPYKEVHLFKTSD